MIKVLSIFGTTPESISALANIINQIKPDIPVVGITMERSV